MTQLRKNTKVRYFPEGAGDDYAATVLICHKDETYTIHVHKALDHNAQPHGHFISTKHRVRGNFIQPHNWG